MVDQNDILFIEPPELSIPERMYLPQIADGMLLTFKHMFKKRLTHNYPEQRLEVRKEVYRGVHRLNKDHQDRVACVACFMCSTACPANCIHIEAAESPWDDREKYPAKFEIDELRCIYCGMCEEACPVDAIELTPEFDIVGLCREEMVFDKEKLLEVYDQTAANKPRKDPQITGYPNTGSASLPD